MKIDQNLYCNGDRDCPVDFLCINGICKPDLTGGGDTTVKSTDTEKPKKKKKKCE